MHNRGDLMVFSRSVGGGDGDDGGDDDGPDGLSLDNVSLPRHG